MSNFKLVTFFQLTESLAYAHYVVQCTLDQSLAKEKLKAERGAFITFDTFITFDASPKNRQSASPPELSDK